jgi:hypothetical protein
MTISLDNLPFDILFHVASYINLEDAVHLSHSCRQLNLLLQEGTLCRKLVEVDHLHSHAFLWLTFPGSPPLQQRSGLGSRFKNLLHAGCTKHLRAPACSVKRLPILGTDLWSGHFLPIPERRALSSSRTNRSHFGCAYLFGNHRIESYEHHTPKPGRPVG